MSVKNCEISILEMFVFFINFINCYRIDKTLQFSSDIIDILSKLFIFSVVNDSLFTFRAVSKVTMVRKSQ